MPNQEPTPAVPLDYYEDAPLPWRSVVRFMAFLGLIYATVVTAQASLIVYAATGFWGIGLSGPECLFRVLFPMVFGVLLMAGSVTSLALKPVGRMMVLWGCFGICACWAALVVCDNDAFRLRAVNYRLANECFSMLYRASAPALLWVIFRRQEVRGLFAG